MYLDSDFPYLSVTSCFLLSPKSNKRNDTGVIHGILHTLSGHWCGGYYQQQQWIYNKYVHLRSYWTCDRSARKTTAGLSMWMKSMWKGVDVYTGCATSSQRRSFRIEAISIHHNELRCDQKWHHNNQNCSRRRSRDILWPRLYHGHVILRWQRIWPLVHYRAYQTCNLS